MDSNHAESFIDELLDDDDIALSEKIDPILEEDESFSNNTAIIEPHVDEIQLQTIATRLEGDFKRKQAPLNRADVDRWVLKRNLNPYEMIELSALLKAKGIEVEDGIKQSSSPRSHGIDTIDAFDTRNMLNKKKVLLKRDQEIELGRAIRLALGAQDAIEKGYDAPNEEINKLLARGKKAEEMMIYHNLGLVRHVVKKYKNRGIHLDEDDLFQEGVIGLMTATQKFDPEMGFKFATYAMWWIRQAITRGLSDKDRLIRVPVHRLEQMNKYRRAIRYMYSERGREPSNRDAAAALGWTEEFTAFIENLTQVKAISLETPTGGDEEDSCISDFIRCADPTPEERLREHERGIRVRDLVSTLEDREQEIISRRFGINELRNNETLEQIGTSYNLTRERIRQIESKALDRLKLRGTKAKLLSEIREP